MATGRGCGVAAPGAGTGAAVCAATVPRGAFFPLPPERRAAEHGCRRGGTVMPKRAVLSFSGGLDTSAILTWMVKEQGWEVITFTGNLGQSGSDSLHVAEEKA